MISSLTMRSGILSISLLAVYLFVQCWFSPVSAAATSLNPSYFLLQSDSFKKLQAGKRILRERDHIIPEKPTVYLTFDDGPSQWTPHILDILKEEGVKASFFALGQLAEKRSEMIKRIADEGHSLGNHTYDHEYKNLYSDFQKFWDQLQQTEEVLYRITGKRPSIMRAPGGTYTNFDAFYFYYIDQLGYQIHDWNIDSGDSKRLGVPAEEIIARVKKGPFRHEINLLMHDGSTHEETVKALPEIIRFLKSKGYSFAALSENVKPIHFSSKPTKWKRKTSIETHAAMMMKLSEQMVLVKRSGKVSTASSTEIRQIKSEEKHETVHVQLRALIDKIGGTVDWKDRERKAVITYDNRTIEYHIDSKMMIIKSPNQFTKVIARADFTIEKGSIIVPQHITLEILDYHIRGNYV